MDEICFEIFKRLSEIDSFHLQIFQMNFFSRWFRHGNYKPNVVAVFFFIFF